MKLTNWLGVLLVGLLVVPASIVDNWKLLRNRDGSRVELYNLVADPMEVDNVADRHPRVAWDLTEMLIEWQAGLGPCLMCEDEGDNTYNWP